MTEKYAGWAILELMGHRRLAGYVSEQELAGVGFLRLDVPALDDQPPATQFYSAAAVYCLTPTTQEIAEAVARTDRPVPVQRWELPALPARASREENGGEDAVDEDDEDDGIHTEGW